MGQFDEQYNAIVNDIIRNGYSDVGSEVRTVWEDGSKAHTKSLIAKTMRFDNSEIPILTTKKVAWEKAIKELLWIWQKRSNNVQHLRDCGVNVWNQWELEDGTIGKGYGYQLNKSNQKVNLNNKGEGFVKDSYCFINQVDYLIYQLKTNPNSRRHITMLWNPDELHEMALMPCVYETQWHVKGGKLHLEVRARSNDMGLGNPFNVFQYNVLQRMMAQVTGYELGEYIYHIGDAHVYTLHIDKLAKQIQKNSYEVPIFKINNDTTDFYKFKIEDFELIDYKSHESIKMEVAI